MKRLFLGLIVAVVAISASAFTNAESTKRASSYLIQLSSGEWTLTTVTPFADPLADCVTPQPRQCAYDVNVSTLSESPANLNGTYTQAQIDRFIASPTQISSSSGSSNGIYTP